MIKIVWRNYLMQSLLGAGLVIMSIATLLTNQNHSGSTLAKQLPIANLANPQKTCEAAGSEPMMRTELFLGLRKPNGTTVNNAEFQQFLDREITPRFPDGFTLLTGQGQFKNARGVILAERTQLLILLYPVATTSSQQIEQIRQAYTSAFQQQSVLRADELSCASF